MKKIISNLNKAFDNKVRLGIMSMLMVNDWVEFKTLKEMLELDIPGDFKRLAMEGRKKIEPKLRK